MITLADLRQFRAMLRPIRTALANSIARGVVQLVDDAKKLQVLQLGVLEGETVDDCERFQEFGFNSVPLSGAEVVVLFPQGERAHPLVVAVDDRQYRPLGWTAGEAGTYNAFSAQMRHKADGTTEITGGGAAASLATLASLEALKDIFDAWVVAPNDGGAALFAALAAWTPAGTTKLKGE